MHPFLSLPPFTFVSFMRTELSRHHRSTGQATHIPRTMLCSSPIQIEYAFIDLTVLGSTIRRIMSGLSERRFIVWIPYGM